MHKNVNFIFVCFYHLSLLRQILKHGVSKYWLNECIKGMSGYRAGEKDRGSHAVRKEGRQEGMGRMGGGLVGY